MFPDASGMNIIKIPLRAMGFTVVAATAFWGASFQPLMTLFFQRTKSLLPVETGSWPVFCIT